MLNIAFTSRDAQLAEEMKTDLTASGLTLIHDYLLVLVSSASLQDNTVMQAVKEATGKKQRIVPVLVERVALPAEISGSESLDFTRGYRKDRLVYFLRWADIGKAKIAANRRIMMFMLLIVVIMFAAAWIGITGGLVAFPQSEYETEDAQENATINAMMFPTLDGWMPRTTEDAQDFPATLAAAPTRIRPFLMLTATALPRDRQATVSFQDTAAAGTMTAEVMRMTEPASTEEANATEPIVNATEPAPTVATTPNG